MSELPPGRFSSRVPAESSSVTAINSRANTENTRIAADSAATPALRRSDDRRSSFGSSSRGSW